MSIIRNASRKKRLFIAVGTAVTALAIGVAGAQSASAYSIGGAPINPAKPVYISNHANRTLVLDIAGGSTQWGLQTALWGINGGPNQTWTFVPAGTVPVNELGPTGGTTTFSLQAYRIQSTPDGVHTVCLEASGANPTVGAIVDTYGCNPNAVNQPNQLWIPQVQTAFDSNSKLTDPVTQSQGSILLNAAMISSTDQSSPVLSVNDTMQARQGSKLTMQTAHSTGIPGYTQLWDFDQVAAAKPGPAATPASAPASSGCSGYSCLFDGGNFTNYYNSLGVR